VVEADIMTNNGTIHAIDEVILPNEFLNIVQIASKNYNLSTLVTLVADNGLVPTLEGSGPFTVFAPTNAAFDAVSETLDGLSAAQVEEVLTYHVAAQQIMSGDLPAPGNSTTVPTVQGEDITVAVDSEGAVTLNGSVNVTTVDLLGTNGVIHIIDGVLLPPSYTAN
jgi:transforming growth factor-beta-induced protein